MRGAETAVPGSERAVPGVERTVPGVETAVPGGERVAHGGETVNRAAERVFTCFFMPVPVFLLFLSDFFINFMFCYLPTPIRICRFSIKVREG